VTALAARARGLTTRLIADDLLGAIERAADAAALATALGKAGVVLAGAPTGATLHAVIEGAVRARAAGDLAALIRWTDGDDGALDAITLDEDRRSLRAIARGLAAGASAARRLEGAVPTARLPAPVLTALAGVATVDELAAALTRRAHPFAAAVADAARPHDPHGARRRGAARPPLDLLALELALARAWAERARAHHRDRALRAHVAQQLDADNATTALLLAARGADLDADRAFLPGGARLDRATFAAAAAGPQDATRDRLAAAFAGTPLARAVAAREPAAIEDAALAWQLATQSRLRRSEPHGLAPVLHLVLRRRAESRRLRRAGWRVAMGGAP
jgi:vacuolar-type H+-ATPase subunit C/Vma6